MSKSEKLLIFCGFLIVIAGTLILYVTESNKADYETVGVTVLSTEIITTAEETATMATAEEMTTAAETTVISEIATTVAGKDIGEFKITVYTPSSDGGKWGYLTASGRTATHLTSCAVDPSVIPLGSVIKVNGLTLSAIDTGSAVKGNVIDIFYDGTDEEAIEWISSFGNYHTVEVIEYAD